MVLKDRLTYHIENVRGTKVKSTLTKIGNNLTNVNQTSKHLSSANFVEPLEKEYYL